MKKILFVFVFCLSFSRVFAQSSASPGMAEISFSFKRQSGFSTNQFAVWIEDSRGTLVKTLFATKFTAGGGYARRPMSIPLWVSKSGLSSLDKKAVDGFSGATPRNGTLNYSWDGTDKNGIRLAPGEYRVFLEGTLKADNKVLYSVPITLGSGTGNPVEREARPEYSGSRTRERDMLGNVKVSYRP